MQYFLTLNWVSFLSREAQARGRQTSKEIHYLHPPKFVVHGGRKAVRASYVAGLELLGSCRCEPARVSMQQKIENQKQPGKEEIGSGAFEDQNK